MHVPATHVGFSSTWSFFSMQIQIVWRYKMSKEQRHNRCFVNDSQQQIIMGCIRCITLHLAQVEYQQKCFICSWMHSQNALHYPTKMDCYHFTVRLWIHSHQLKYYFFFIKLLPEVICVSADDKSDYAGGFNVLRAGKMPPNTPKDGSDLNDRFSFQLNSSPKEIINYDKNQEDNIVSRNKYPSAKRLRYNYI